MEDIREIELDKGLRKICSLSKIPGSDAIGKWIRTERLKGLKKDNELVLLEILDATTFLTDFMRTSLRAKSEKPRIVK